MSLVFVFGDGPQSTIALRSRQEKPPDVPIIKSVDFRVRNDHGDAYIDPAKMQRKPAPRSTIKIEEIFPGDEMHRDKRIKQEYDDDDDDESESSSHGRQLAIEAKPGDYGHFAFEQNGLVSGSPLSSDDDDNDDALYHEEGTEITDPSAAAAALQLFADPVVLPPPPERPWHSSSHSTHYDSGRDRVPLSPRGDPVEGGMPYEQPRFNRGGLFGDGVEHDYSASYNSGAREHDAFSDDSQWCPACDAALHDISKRCGQHGERLVPRPVPRSDAWKLTTSLHGLICSPSLCVFCTDMDITVGRPIEIEVNNMIVRTPEVLKLAGMPAAALFLQKTWKSVCEKYQNLIPAEKRNLYLQMNGPSILWHFSEHACIAEIFIPMNEIEMRSYSRRVRDNDVPGGVGVDENSVTASTGLSYEGLRKLKLIEGLARQHLMVAPSKTNSTYNRVPQPSGAFFAAESRKLRIGSHLK